MFIVLLEVGNMMGCVGEDCGWNGLRGAAWISARWTTHRVQEILLLRVHGYVGGGAVGAEEGSWPED